MESISLSKYLKLIANNYKIVIYFILGMMILALLTGIVFYKHKYASDAKILVQNMTQSTFLVDLGTEQKLATSGNKNPILTQMELFASKEMAEKVWESLSKNIMFSDYTKNSMIKLFQRRLFLKSPPGTDIIEVSFVWEKPDDAQIIAKEFVDAFLAYNVDMNKQSIAQMKKYIERQLNTSIKELDDIRDEIKNFRRDNNSVNIDKEAVSVIDQITLIENQISEIDRQLQSEKSISKVLASKLDVGVARAIKSIALGQNDNLLALQRQLQDAQQEFAVLNVRYTPTNPRMKAVTENLRQIESQINSQIIATIGKKLNKKQNSIITDPVRTDIVHKLISSQTSLYALASQKKSLLSTLAQFRAKMKKIPAKQEKLRSLLQKENTLAAIVETLNTKLIEARVREAEIVSNLKVIDEPSLPTKPRFPTIFHIVLIFGILGALLGVATVLGIYYVEDTCEGTTELESILKAPVLGVIPWLSETNYKTSGSGYNPASIISIVYQKIITSIRIKSLKKKISIIGISSAEFEKKRSVISVNVAKGLASSGNSVLILDADFRHGCIAKEFNINTEARKDLTDVLMDICVDMNNATYDPSTLFEALNSAIIKVPEHNNLCILPNNSTVSNPYEILNVQAFPELINYLKNKFDYIIVDTPPILAVPDTIVTSQYLDGLIVLCGIKTSRSNLLKVQKTCEENYVELLGAIARDTTTELEMPESQYIKQLSV